MKPVGVFQVVGPGAYRGHAPGTTFSGALDKPSLARAVQRGNITVVSAVGGTLPENYALPREWGQ